MPYECKAELFFFLDECKAEHIKRAYHSFYFILLFNIAFSIK